MMANTDIHELSPKERVKNWIKLVNNYWQPIVRIMDPLHVFMKAKFCDPNTETLRDELLDLHIKHQNQEGSEKLLQWLLDAQDHSPEHLLARWQLFKMALKEVHPVLHEIILDNTYQPDVLEYQLSLLKFFMDDITQIVNPMHLLPSIFKESLMSQEMCECLRSICDQKGETLGAVYMVCNIHRIRADWYDVFLELLVRNDYEEVAKNVDDKAYKKIMDRLRASESCVKDTSLLEVHGEAYKPGFVTFAGAPLLESEDEPSTSLEGKGDKPSPSLEGKRDEPSTLSEGKGDDPSTSSEEKGDEPFTSLEGMGNEPSSSSDWKGDDASSSSEREAEGEGRGAVSASSSQYTKLQSVDSEETEVLTSCYSNLTAQSRQSTFHMADESDDSNDFYSCESSEETDDPEQVCSKVVWNAPASAKGMKGTHQKNVPGHADGFDNRNPEQKELMGKNIEFGSDDADRLIVSMDDSNEEWKGEQDGEMREVEPEPLILRPYQKELAREGMMGKNVIIVAPTGSGKTHVALSIIKNHLEQVGSGVRKVVFLVNQVALAQQQYDACCKYLTPSWRTKLVTGNAGASATEKVPLKHLMMRADILVMTAQILVNALYSRELDGVCTFSLVVFDECHHTALLHPFNCIMHFYMDVKFRSQDEQELTPSLHLPQVVGLTASVGVGKAGNQEQARKHIVKLCAHLDVHMICTVNEHREELAYFSNDPKYEQHICLKRPNDKFQEQIEEFMKTIETRMEMSKYLNSTDTQSLREKLKLRPRFRGTSQYTGWVSELFKAIAMLDDADTRRFFEAARVMLKFYNESLVINDECDTQEALEFLNKQMEEYDPLGKRDREMDCFLKELFDKNLPFLTAVSRAQLDTNPKLKSLEELILKAFKEEPNSRAIVFVKTRDLSIALLRWMNRRPQLKVLKPSRMVGAGQASDKGGMTKNQQVDEMEFFKTGEHKVLIATSVAEEGLDIRKCNLVIRYNYVTNEIAMVQARGRARAENSQFLTLASPDKGVQAKEEVNFIREMMMNEAIKGLQSEIKTSFGDFRKEVEDVQREEKSKRDAELVVRRGRRLRQGDVVFRCRSCDEYAFVSSDVRKIEGIHHVVMDLDYRNRTIERSCPPKEYGQIQVRGLVSCKGCGENWGPILRFQDVKFACIRLEGFRLLDEHGRKDIPKRWKQVQIIIDDLEPDELMRYREEAIAVDYVDMD